MQNFTRQQPGHPRHGSLLRAMRFLGAVSLLGVGAVHLQQYLGANFRTVPTIGPLVLLNAIGCGVVGFTLLMPIERPVSARRAHFVVAVARDRTSPPS